MSSTEKFFMFISGTAIVIGLMLAFSDEGPTIAEAVKNLFIYSGAIDDTGVLRTYKHP